MTTISINDNNTYLGCLDDGLFMGDAGPWALKKLTYLSRYLYIATTSMHQQKWRGLHYIDLFSGSGKNRIKTNKKIILGSPLLAITQANPFDRYYFVDSNQIAIDALKKRCGSSTQMTKIQFFVEDGNQAVRKITREIESIDHQYITNKWSSFNIAFIDPYGLELKWNTIELLAKIRIMDLIIYYPQMGLTREMPRCFNNPLPNNIDSFFGCCDWRGIYEDYQAGKVPYLHRALMDLYWKNLQKLGYVENKETEPLMRNAKRNAPLYRLIHASKHKLAGQFWNQTTKTDDTGQPKLF